MLKKIFYMLPFIFIISLLIFNQNSTNHTLHKFYNDLKRYNLIDHSYDEIINSALQEIISANNLENNISINKKYNNNTSIYVIDFYKLKDKTINNKLINMCKNNFITYPPNIICIDNYLLYSFGVEAVRDSLTKSRLMRESDNLNFDYEKEKPKMESVDEYQRIALFKEDKNEELDKNKHKDFTHGSGRIIGIIYGKDLNNSYNPLQSYIKPILAHELAHINSNEFGFFIKNNNIISKISDKTTYTREDNADKEALKYIKNYLKNIKNRNTGDIYFDAQYSFDQHLQLYWFARYMKDRLIFEIFDEFRGFEAKDIAITISQKRLNELSEEEKKLRYFFYERVESAYHNKFPIFTKKEYMKISEQIKEKTSTHPNILYRLSPILEIASLKNETLRNDFFEEFERYFLLMNSIEKELDKNETLNMFGLKYFNQDYGLNSNMFFDEFNKTYSFEKSAFNHYDKCKIGFQEKTKNYIEVCGDENLYYINLVNFWTGIDKNDTAINQIKALNKNIAPFYSLFEVLAPSFYESKDGQKKMLDWYEKLYYGYYPFFVEEINNYYIVFSRINNTPFTSIIIIHKKGRLY